ncbi:MAG TPA: WG repeat-containing protein [Kamptonema sp.]|nr:WG repeat-containing protein [Kamptonema sp.]
MPNAENFSDIQSHWAQKCIVQLAQQEVVNGYPDRTFRPESTITRAEFAAMLVKAFPNIKPVRDAVAFTDVSEKNWAYKAIKFASETRFFEGYPDRTFKPELVLTRVQAIAILANGLKYQPMSPPTETLRKYFDDAADIPSYARSAIAAATENFLIVNYPNVRKLQPNKNATRGEIAALMCQALKIENVLPPQYTPWSEFLVIPPIFDGAESFSSGVAWVKIGKKYGAIDKTGKLLIQPEYYLHYPFFEGLALVTIGGKFRYIDRTGNIVIQQDFEEADSFIEGLAAVKIGGKVGFIDTKGKMVIQPQFESAIYFSEGLAAVRVQDKHGFIDKTGKLVIPAKFNWAFSFNDGVALVVENDKSGFIDKTGKFTEIILDYTLTDAIGNFSEGLARVSLSVGEGYIDKTGKLAIQPQFKSALPFSEGVAAVYNGEKFGYINKKGEVVIPFKFNSAASFYEGLARVEVEGKFGFIDRGGNYVIKPQFSRSYYDFSEGLASVYLGFDKWGYIRTPL